MKSSHHFGLIESTNSYNNFNPPHSPSDRLNLIGKKERAAQFGLCHDDIGDESFECNQSFPRAMQPHSKYKQSDLAAAGDITHIRGCELNSVNFLKRNLLIKNQNSSRAARRHLLNDTVLNRSSTTNQMNASYLSQSNCGGFDKSWMFYNQFLNSNNQMDSCEDQLLTLNNPNKALIVINGRTTEILTANDISCDLFGYNESELIGLRLKDLLDLGDSVSSERKEALMEADRLDQHGRVVLCSGKIFEAFTRSPLDDINENENENGEEGERNEETSAKKSVNNNNKLKLPISMYMLKLTDEQEPRCLCVMEPIQRIVGTFTINFKGRLCNYNPSFSYIFGYTNAVNQAPMSLSTLTTTSLLNGKEITEIIPSMKLPINGILPEVRKQLLTGRSLQGENIPLTVNILNKHVYNEEIVYNCNVSVYTNISGLITVRPTDYQINSYNPTFSRLLFGYDEKDLLNKPITYLIPNFFDPDTTSSVTNKMTPYNTNNNSYMANSSSRKKYSNNNKSSTNINGSFLDHQHKHEKIPEFVITDACETNSNSTLENEEPTTTTTKTTKACKQCQKKFVPSTMAVINMRKRKANDEMNNEEEMNERDLLAEFNLEGGENYSPNKKCANYLEANSFSPCLASRQQQNNCPSPCNTPQSNAKRTLLAKAITNNAITTNNQQQQQQQMAMNTSLQSNSNDQMSCMSICSSIGDCSPTTSPSKSSRMVDLNDLMETETETETTEDLCDECRLSKDSEMAVDKSEVSLIMEQTTSGNTHNKITLTSDKDRRRSSLLLSDLNVIKESGGGEENGQEANKFKNITSTPAALHIKNVINYGNSNSKSNQIGLNTSDGLFFGRAKHHDGSHIKVFYQRKLVSMNNLKDKENVESEQQQQQDLICVWVSRDPYSDKSIMDHSLDQSLHHFRMNPNGNMSFAPHNATDHSSPYLNEYEDIRTLGRGASGFVQLAHRKLDKFEVVTKYILKSKIYKENLVNDDRYGTVPLEISILCKLDHANVIKVLEVFHDQDHVQMVMEKHGCGMDLFEFIDRQRRHIDEALASYIFRQLVSAVAYLHSKNIVHRDIKDENIVINEQFHIKLIDFGSAAYMAKGKKFATFCGTMDYCSPDILLGNKYYGPELDVWTCGIALYTLIFCENPFLSAEETIECILKPPFKVSKELMKLLFSILCPKPELRATMEEIESNEWVNQPVDMSKFKWENVVRNTEFHANTAGDCFRDDEYNISSKAVAANEDQNKMEEEQQHEMVNVNKQQNNFFKLNTNIFSKSF